MKTKLILATLLAALLTPMLGPAQEAQLLGKRRPGANSKVTAVGKLKMDGMPAGIHSGLSISLRSRTGDYDEVIGSSPDPIRNALKTGKFTFRNVPAGTPMVLTIRFHPPTGEATAEYRATYRFVEGHEGNMGTFRVTIQPPSVTCDR